MLNGLRALWQVPGAHWVIPNYVRRPYPFQCSSFTVRGTKSYCSRGGISVTALGSLAIRHVTILERLNFSRDGLTSTV